MRQSASRERRPIRRLRRRNEQVRGGAKRLHVGIRKHELGRRRRDRPVDAFPAARIVAGDFATSRRELVRVRSGRRFTARANSRNFALDDRRPGRTDVRTKQDAENLRNYDRDADHRNLLRRTKFQS